LVKKLDQFEESFTNISHSDEAQKKLIQELHNELTAKNEQLRNHEQLKQQLRVKEEQIVKLSQVHKKINI
jgi:hypothetical protein